MGFDGLAVLVLQQVGKRSLKSTWRTAAECRCMSAGPDTIPCRLVSDQAHTGIIEKRVEDADSVGSSADTSYDRVGQSARLCLDLRTCLEADNSLKITHHGREGMRAGRSSEAVVGVLGVGDPIP